MGSRVKFVFVAFAPMVFFISGCAKKLPPLEDIQDAKIALVKAKDADALELANRSFELAKKHYEDIKVYMSENDYEKAKYSAQKAFIEAKLSQNIAQNAKIEKKIDKLSGEVSILKKEFTTISE